MRPSKRGDAMKRTVLFLCTHNAARSQMAEGLLNARYDDRYDAYSAGVTPTAVNAYVIEAMAEIGIDLSEKHSKSIDEFRGWTFDYVVTVCDHAKETCPFFPGKIVLHQRFEDPCQFTGEAATILAEVRRVRDAINAWITTAFSPHKESMTCRR
jgi:arsenate reductase